MSTPISTDLMLVERSNTWYKCTKAAFDAGITSSDLILVERGGSLYKETYGNKANIDSTDLLATERSNIGYKVTWSDWLGTSGSSGGFSGTGQDIYTANYTKPVVIYPQNSYEGSADTNRAYDIVQFQVHAGAASVSGHLYMGWKNNAVTTYYGDICIGVVQVLNPAKSSLRYSWHGDESVTSPQFIDRATSVVTGSTSHTTDPSSLNYTTPNTSPSVNYWSRGNYTSSAYTGANNGISTTYKMSSGTILTGSTVSQATSYYAMVEQSGASRYNLAWSRMGQSGSAITLNNGDWVTVAYQAATYSSNGSVSTNSLWFRFK